MLQSTETPALGSVRRAVRFSSQVILARVRWKTKEIPPEAVGSVSIQVSWMPGGFEMLRELWNGSCLGDHGRQAGSKSSAGSSVSRVTLVQFVVMIAMSWFTPSGQVSTANQRSSGEKDGSAIGWPLYGAC